MKPLVTLAVVLALAGCSPPPRTVAEFKAHPELDTQVLAACASGAERGVDCANAETAAQQIRSDQRLNHYKQSF